MFKEIQVIGNRMEAAVEEVKQNFIHNFQPGEPPDEKQDELVKYLQNHNVFHNRYLG